MIGRRLADGVSAEPPFASVRSHLVESKSTKLQQRLKSKLVSCRPLAFVVIRDLTWYRMWDEGREDADRSHREDRRPRALQ